jgi:hypothetical protein
MSGIEVALSALLSDLDESDGIPSKDAHERGRFRQAKRHSVEVNAVEYLGITALSNS